MNILCTLPVTPFEAALGADISFPLMGETINVKIPPLTSRIVPDIDEAEEGSARYRIHLIRERDRKLVEKKKKSQKNLSCEVCNFNFVCFRIRRNIEVFDTENGFFGNKFFFNLFH